MKFKLGAKNVAVYLVCVVVGVDLCQTVISTSILLHHHVLLFNFIVEFPNEICE